MNISDLKTGDLSEYFLGVAWKKLSDVEANHYASNQHEFNGVSGLKDILGTERKKFDAEYFFLSDDEDDNLRSNGSVSWYDARENHPTRSEFRLYYSSNDVVDNFETESVVIFALLKNHTFIVINFDPVTTTGQQLLNLFGISEYATSSRVKLINGQNDQILSLSSIYILDTLGIDYDSNFVENDMLNKMLIRFGESDFPKTKVFSEFIREEFGNDFNSPDDQILFWMTKEEQLFRTLESYHVEKVISKGFGEGQEAVDDFVSYSLSVQNRRKSRAGHAFENHLTNIFEISGVDFSRQKITENRSKPDYIFPSIDHYKK